MHTQCSVEWFFFDKFEFDRVFIRVLHVVYNRFYTDLHIWSVPALMQFVCLCIANEDEQKRWHLTKGPDINIYYASAGPPCEVDYDIFTPGSSNDRLVAQCALSCHPIVTVMIIKWLVSCTCTQAWDLWPRDSAAGCLSWARGWC